MGIFNFLKKEENKSKNIAKDRLKLVLIHDRTMLSPSMIEEMKDEIITVISKYVDIDKEQLNIDIAQEEGNSRRTALIANIPLKNSK